MFTPLWALKDRSAPVANDDVYRTFILYQHGVLTRQQTIEALRIKELSDQYVFKTTTALSLLTFEGARIHA